MAAAETQALFEQLTILLLLAIGSHFLFRRFHQPTIIGEIAVGIVLGPSVVGNAALGPYRLVFDPAVVATLAVLGSIFLLFLIGLDFDFRAVYTPRNIAVAFGGVVLPLVVGFGTALYLAPTTSIGVNGTRFTMGLFVGATFTATSVAITAAVLLEFNFLKDPVAQTILGAAVVDDVLGLIVLSVVVGTSAGRVSALDLAILLAEAVGFLAIGMAAGVYVFRRIVLRIQAEGARLGLPHSGFLVAMAITFLFALTAESIGLSAVVGAFLAGSVFAGAAFRKDFSEGARHLVCRLLLEKKKALPLRARVTVPSASPVAAVIAAMRSFVMAAATPVIYARAAHDPPPFRPPPTGFLVGRGFTSLSTTSGASCCRGPGCAGLPEGGVCAAAALRRECSDGAG